MNRSLTARRTLAAAALAPLLLTGVAACGDDSDGSQGSKGSDTTGSESKDGVAGTSVLANLSEGDEVDADEFVDTVADGVEESTTAHMTMSVSLGDEVATSGEGDIDYTSKPPSIAMSMDIPGAGDTDTIVVDGIFYMRIGELSDGKYWRLDPSDPDSPLGGMGLDKMLNQTDPLGALESMKSAIDTVSFEGTEDVDGRELDHYVLTMDVDAAMDAMGGLSSALPSEAASEVPDSLTYDLWLDDEDRFAQMEMTYPVMGQEMSMEMTADDWGTDVDIEAPPADEVTEMPDMGSMMNGGGASPSA